MKRVVQLLKAHDYRQALVRLWVLGSSPVRLNRWEQARRQDATFAHTESQFLADLQNEIAVSADRAQAVPLALIRALDDFVMANRALGQPAFGAATRLCRPRKRAEAIAWFLSPWLPGAKRL